MKVINLKFSVFNVSLLVTAAFLLFAGTAHAAAPSWQWIDGPRVQNQLKAGSGLWLIDVRSATSYEAGHIEGSVNIPAAVLAHKKFAGQKTLVLVDDSLGQKSARETAAVLARNGQGRVSVLEGGIAAWKSEGLPLIEKKPAVPGVTADELKWALNQSVPFKIYDLRDAKDREKGTLQNAEAVAGKTLNERIDKLKAVLAGNEKKKDLAARIKKPQPMVLVFCARDDAESYTRSILQGTKADIRYLIGGYESTISEQLRKQQTSGACPTCPGGKGK